MIVWSSANIMECIGAGFEIGLSRSNSDLDYCVHIYFHGLNNSVIFLSWIILNLRKGIFLIRNRWEGSRTANLMYFPKNYFPASLPLDQLQSKTYNNHSFPFNCSFYFSLSSVTFFCSFHIVFFTSHEALTY